MASTANGKTAEGQVRIRPRRAGSSLGGHPRGDTGVGSLATLSTLAQVGQRPDMMTVADCILRLRPKSISRKHLRREHKAQSAVLFDGFRAIPGLCHWVSCLCCLHRVMEVQDFNIQFSSLSSDAGIGARLDPTQPYEHVPLRK